MNFPRPAADNPERKIDLNEYLIKHPSSTFFARVVGDSMIDRGIFPGDLLVVDRSLSPMAGNIIVAALNNEFTLKEFMKDKNKIILKAANKNFADIVIQEHDTFEIWGVVTNVIHKYV